MQLREVSKILKRHKKELTRLGVRTLSLFGSVARNEAKEKSDIDVLIEFDSKMGFFVFVNLKNYLETLLNCEVDLVTRNALHPALKKKILNEAKNVF